MYKKHQIAFVFHLLLCSEFVNYISCVKWESFMESAFSGTKEIAEFIEPYVVKNFSFGNVSKECTNSLLKYHDGIKNWIPWAIKMFDATGKPSSGFLRGTFLELGSFDECLAISVKAHGQVDDFKGKFCMLHLKSPLFSSGKRKQKDGKSYIENFGNPPDWVEQVLGIMQKDVMSAFGLYLGICVPSTCTNQDLHHVFTLFTQAADLQFTLTDCQVSEAKKWPTSSKISVGVIAGLISFVMIGTMADFLDQEEINQNVSRKLLKAFSVRSNCKSLFKKNTTDSAIDFICGLKAIFVVWLVAIHVSGYPTLHMEKRYKSGFNVLKPQPPFVILLENGLMSTGYFMFLGGFLISYTRGQKSTTMHNNKAKSNFLHSLFMKYIRNTPLQLFLIILTFAFPLIYDGPLWNSTWESKMNKCRNFGWLNLLYVNNLGPFDNLCWEHTWFLSAFMQLRIFCAGLFFFTKRYLRTGVILGILISTVCLIHDFNVSLNNKFLFPTVSDMKSYLDLRDFGEKIYIRTQHHFIVYVAGMILASLNIRDYKPKKSIIIITWILYIISSITLYFAVKLPTKNLVIIAFYSSFRSILLSFQMALIMFLCLTKSAGVLGTFLEWKGFVPFSKLVSSITMFHPILIVAAEGAMREHIYMDPVNIMLQGIQLFVASCIFGLITYLLVEAPLNRICDLLEGKDVKNYSKASKMS